MAGSAPRWNDFLATIQGMDGGFNPYAAGDKRYGMSGRDAPNIGPTSSPEGYAERDRLKKVRRKYMLRKLKANQKSHYMDSDALRNQAPGTFQT